MQILNQYKNGNVTTTLYDDGTRERVIDGNTPTFLFPENIDVKIKKAILISGYAKLLRENADGENNKEPKWDLIKRHAKEFIFINSDNDPWGCDDTQGKIMTDNLGGKLIVRHDGHMGSTTYNQPYTEFPLLVELIK